MNTQFLNQISHLICKTSGNGKAEITKLKVITNMLVKSRYMKLLFTLSIALNLMLLFYLNERIGQHKEYQTSISLFPFQGYYK